VSTPRQEVAAIGSLHEQRTGDRGHRRVDDLGWLGPGDAQERAVASGWVADPGAVSARLVDITGRTLTDDIENGVFLFMWKGDFDFRSARLDLLDTDQHVTRSGPMRRED
jgi:hypothetical protein